MTVVILMFFRMDSIKLSTHRSQLTIFRLVNIKSATVSSQLTKMKTAKMKKMQVVNLLFLSFNFFIQLI